MNILEATAYHESGHIVVGYFVNLNVEGVTIIPDEDYYGLATHSRQNDFDVRLFELLDNYELPENMTIDEYDDHINRIALQELKTALGGYIAEKIYGIDNTYGANSDFNKVIDLALRHYGSGEEASLQIDKLLLEVETLLMMKWNYVDSLAKALLEKKELSKNEIIQILER